MQITYRAPTPAALDWIADRLCADDLAELKASCGKPPRDVLRESVECSEEATVAWWDDRPQAVFGVAEWQPDPTIGVAWLLGTDAVRTNPREFLRGSREWIAQWAERYRALFNLVSLHHVRAQRWLMWLGFEPIKHHDVRGHSFVEFSRLSYRD